MQEAEKLVLDQEIDLEYELNGGGGLVQASGALAGTEIYFRAKYDEWSFDIAGEDGKLPSDSGEGGYFKKTRFSGAGNMTLNDAEKIINSCINEYMAMKGML